MDYTPIISQVFKLWWVIPIILVIGVLKSPWFKGMAGEALVKLAAHLRLPKDIYHPIHNVTLPTPDGTTQIDHILVSRFGVFVIETKHMKGWIFGSEKDPQWTQKLFKKSFRFQNPLRQNYKHTKALQAALGIPPAAIHSVLSSQVKVPSRHPCPPTLPGAAGTSPTSSPFSSPCFPTSRSTKSSPEYRPFGYPRPVQPAASTSRTCARVETQTPIGNARDAAVAWSCVP